MYDLAAHVAGLATRFPHTDEHHLAHAARLPGGITKHLAATHHLTEAEAQEALEDFVLFELGRLH